MRSFYFRTAALGMLFLASAASSVRCQTTSVLSQTVPAEFSDPRRLLQQGKFDEAIAQLLDLQKQNPAMKCLSHELGTAYYKKSDFLNAAIYLKKAQEEDPSDSEATQLLGISYYLAGRPAEAIPALEKVQTWYPSANVDASYILGVCYIQTKNYDNARKAFAKMFNVGTDSAPAY